MTRFKYSKKIKKSNCPHDNFNDCDKLDTSGMSKPDCEGCERKIAADERLESFKELYKMMSDPNREQPPPRISDDIPKPFHDDFSTKNK